MSRAFVKEDAELPQPRRDFGLPPRGDRSYDAAAALALLEGARDGFMASAEEATGYRWGDPHLRKHIERLLDKEQDKPDDEQDRRFMLMAKRYLRFNPDEE